VFSTGVVPQIIWQYLLRQQFGGISDIRIELGNIALVSSK
jgi:hypothetical protein